MPKEFNRIMRRLALIATALLFLFVGAGRTVAKSDTPPGGFTVAVEPSKDPAITEKGYFTYSLEAGKRGTGRLLLTNPTNETITIELAAVDAATARNGGSDFAPSDAKPTAIGTWLNLAKTRVSLEAGKQQAVKVTVRVPKTVAPGQYLAGIVAYKVEDRAAEETVEAKANEANAVIDVQTRYAIAVQVDVPGDWAASMTISQVQLLDWPSGAVVGITMRNDGSAFIKPKGTLTLADAQGKIAFQQPIEMGTFITGTEVTYPISWPATLLPGTYGIHVALTYGEEQTATYDGMLEAGASTAPTITIAGVTVDESRDQATKQLQFVTIGITVENPDAPIPNARLTLHVTRDGETVEDLVLGDALTFPQGTAQASQRYLPPTGWTPGTYSFSVTLDAIDPGSGQATPLNEATAATTVTVE